MSPAERQALQRKRRAAQLAAWQLALQRIAAADSLRDARQIAAIALGDDTGSTSN